MGPQPEVNTLARATQTHRPAILLVVLWAYAAAFGFIALAGVYVLDLVMDASGLRTGAELAIMSGAALLGTYLSTPALKVTHRSWKVATGADPAITLADPP